MAALFSEVLCLLIGEGGRLTTACRIYRLVVTHVLQFIWEGSRKKVRLLVALQDVW